MKKTFIYFFIFLLFVDSTHVFASAKLPRWKALATAAAFLISCVPIKQTNPEYERAALAAQEAEVSDLNSHASQILWVDGDKPIETTLHYSDATEQYSAVTYTAPVGVRVVWSAVGFDILQLTEPTTGSAFLLKVATDPKSQKPVYPAKVTPIKPSDVIKAVDVDQKQEF